MEQAITAIRRFNRFYTQAVGALDARFLDSAVTLPEARLLFEIGGSAPVAARALQAGLDMDGGYVSRILARFEGRGWITRLPDPGDARARLIALTPDGQAVLDVIDTRQRQAVAAMLDRLGPVQRDDLTRALTMARLLLGPETASCVTVRPFATGDMGAIASRQARLYADSHGWGRELEVIEGQVTTDFLRDFKPGREQGWVAELDGVMAGSVLLTDEGGGTARLRLLYVEPFARGRGIGARLVDACVAFAGPAGFDRITLWTHTVLEDARRLYARHGFVLVETAMHEAFGVPLQGETWMRALGQPDPV